MKEHWWHSKVLRTVSTLLRLTGPVTVNGKTYNSVMPPMSQLNDDEIANILTYVTHAWGNQGTAAFSAAEIHAVRQSTARPPGAAN